MQNYFIVLCKTASGKEVRVDVSNTRQEAENYRKGINAQSRSNTYIREVTEAQLENYSVL